MVRIELIFQVRGVTMQEDQLLEWVLGVPAALIHATGYVLYNIQTKRGSSKPKFVTWFIWMIAATINAVTFTEVTSFPLALQYIVGSFAATVTFILALRWKKFKWPDSVEIFVLVLCVLSFVVYWYYRDASTANLIMMLTVVISFHPTLKDVYKDPTKDEPLSWWVWTVACLVTLLNATLSYNGDFVSIFNPAYLALFHLVVAVLARKGR